MRSGGVFLSTAEAPSAPPKPRIPWWGHNEVEMALNTRGGKFRPCRNTGCPARIILVEPPRSADGKRGGKVALEQIGEDPDNKQRVMAFHADLCVRAGAPSGQHPEISHRVKPSAVDAVADAEELHRSPGQRKLDLQITTSSRRNGRAIGRYKRCWACGKQKSSPKSNERIGRGSICNECYEARALEEATAAMKQEGHKPDCICVECRTHDLKCWPEFFQAILDGRKTFEVRRNDRGFLQGDQLLLKEWQPGSGEYTGREMLVFVSYSHELPCMPGFVGMSVQVVGGTHEYELRHLEPTPQQIA
jgi:hypothetical protein